MTPPGRVVSCTLRRPALSGTFNRNEARALPGSAEFEGLPVCCAEKFVFALR